jgi:phosphate transport system substrate-binding protein
MKLFLSFLSLPLLAGFFITATVPDAVCQPRLSGQISISGAFALYPMAVKWADAYRKINPGVRIDISAGGAGKGISDALSGMVEIGMVSREIYPEEIKKGAFPVAVAKDAVVATVNELNPAIKDIMTQGLKKDAGNNIWITGKYTSWAQAFGVKITSPVHMYTRSDACGAAEVWATYFGGRQEDLLGTGVFGDPGLAMAVRKDPLGIGFNNIGYVYDAATRKPIKGLMVLPLDLNNNGKVDAEENFYSSLDELITAISTGKYPSPPARELFFVTKGNPRSNKLLADFIKWVLTDGQKFVTETGYISLPGGKNESELKKLQ